jgi:hypothetical protein
MATKDGWIPLGAVCVAATRAHGRFTPPRWIPHNALTSTQITDLGDYLSAFQQQLSGYWDIGLYGQGGTSPSNELQSICHANPWYASLPFWATNAQPSCGAAIIQLEDQPTVCDYTTDTDSTTTSVYGVWFPS